MNYFWVQAHRLRYELRNVVAGYPWLYLPLARLKSEPPATQAVGDTTQLLIEAWPRSGNTFAEQAFRLSQPSQIELAHHFHAPAHVIAAVKRDLPTLIIVRDAIDSVSSFLIRDPVITPDQALRSWIRFHEKIMPYCDGYVTAAFEQVIEDFGAVIRRVNRRFNTKFAIFDHTPENVAVCFSIIESNSRNRSGGVESVETRIARPSTLRNRKSQLIKEVLQSDNLAPLVRRARAIHENYMRWAYTGE